MWDVYITQFTDALKNWYSCVYHWYEWKIDVQFFFFEYAILAISKVLVDAAAHFEQGVLIRCDMWARLIERSEPECVIWCIAIREPLFKIKYKN
jgi:hypothetical protein